MLKIKVSIDPLLKMKKLPYSGINIKNFYETKKENALSSIGKGRSKTDSYLVSLHPQRVQ